jgi:fucose permease
MTVPTAVAASRTNPASSIAIVGVLFFVIGFFTWLNGPLITFVRLAFDLDEVNAFLVLMVFYLSYFFLALPRRGSSSAPA